MKNFLIGIGVFVVLAAVIWIFIPKSQTTIETATTGTIATTTVPVSSPSTTEFTLADVLEHNSASSCYSAINGSVYDLTAWISLHPGGQENILSICGKDGSAAFNDQHGNDSRPNTILATYKIGTLK